MHTLGEDLVVNPPFSLWAKKWEAKKKALTEKKRHFLLRRERERETAMKGE